MSQNGDCHWLDICATKQFERYLMCINHISDHEEQCERFLLRGILCDKKYQVHCSSFEHKSQLSVNDIQLKQTKDAE
jgi:hypothetical protein